jgi:type VI secretion system protein ImpJ
MTAAMTHCPTPPAPHIQWHEGMLLSPQHFQQESARVDALIAWQHLAVHPLGWGVRHLDIDTSLLVNGLVRVRSLEAVMPDGMAVTWPTPQAGGPDLALDLTPLAAQLEAQELPIYLTVGRARSQRVSAQPARLRGILGEPVEDEISEALPVDIPRAVPNLALAIGPRPSSAYLCLKLMTVRKDNEVFKRGGYVPALLEVPPDCEIRQRAQALAAQIRSKAAFLVKQTADPSSRIEDRLAMLEGKARLGSLVAALPVLEALLRGPAVPPFALYLALCAQLGPLATLRPGAVPLLPPPWVHDDPSAAIGPVLDALEDLAGEVSQEWRTTVFGFDGEAFALPLDAASPGSRLVVGVRGQPERDLVAWMSGAVIGSRTVWSALSDRRVLGAARRRIEDAPELGLRSSAGYTLFAIEVAESFIVAGQPLVISNANETSAMQRPHEMVLFVKG